MPQVVFLQVGDDIELATLMVKSVQRAIPGMDIVQLSDLASPQVDGTSDIRRRPYNGLLMPFRLEHLAALDGEWISLDTDVLVMADLRPVFEQAFDVALTYRRGPIWCDGVDITIAMPFNTGVMFSRNPAFWQQAHERLLHMPKEAHQWWGDQLAVKAISERNSFNVLHLDCEEWNHTPANESSYPPAKVLHFKGSRKEWMKNVDFYLR